MPNYISESSIDQEYANLDGMKYVVDMVLEKWTKPHFHRTAILDAKFRITVGEDYYMTDEEQAQHDVTTFTKAISEKDLQGSDPLLMIIARSLVERAWSDVIYADPVAPKKLLAFNLSIAPIESNELEGGKGYLMTGEVVV